MDWQQLKENVYYQDGSLRDIYVHHVTRKDWQLWADYVNTHYKTSVLIYETQAKTDTIDIGIAFAYWNRSHDNCSTASVYLDEIQVNIHFFRENEIENDLTPTEVKSVEDHNKVLAYMKEMSNVLNKEVVLTPENEPETVLISVNRDKTFINL
ncbi:hypothetical protein LX87_05035 [Larkinella arboricola]|uniref:Uncharacterized protein n=1 Tax=Larkinella arboricola TaxID=643671 RepID=A0A327WNW9_LARAB|nr:hypothetical protein [Larkinella arboricola]RAJ92704.1 hypothetical protein LX87_05035 [Larkinella arboricola]